MSGVRQHGASPFRLFQTRPQPKSLGPGDKQWGHTNEGNEEWRKLDDGTRPGAMSESKFNQVKFAYQHDIGADMISDELKIAPNEIKKAILAKDYSAYLAS